MDIFKEEVGGEEQILAGAARPEDGAIVANSENEIGAGGE
jgi:hypothetical protein